MCIRDRKYSQRWQQQHTADELKTIAAAVNYLSEHGISNLDEDVYKRQSSYRTSMWIVTVWTSWWSSW